MIRYGLAHVQETASGGDGLVMCGSSSAPVPGKGLSAGLGHIGANRTRKQLRNQ